jgi:hypothetical protein
LDGGASLTGRKRDTDCGIARRAVTVALSGLRLHDQKVDRLHRAVIEGERAKVTKAKKDINLVVEQRWALASERLALESVIGSLREAIAASGAKLKEAFVRIEWQAKDCQRQSQEREGHVMPDVRCVVGRFGSQVQDIVEENDPRVLAGAEMRRAKKQLRAEVRGLKLCTEVLDNLRLSEAKEVRRQRQEEPGLSNDLGELITVVGLPGGSRVTGGLSARSLANVVVRDWSDDFTFIIGERRYPCRL